MAKEDPRRYPKGEGVESRPITVSDADSAYEILKMSAVAASCDPPPRDAIVRTLQQLEPTRPRWQVCFFHRPPETTRRLR